MKPFIPDVMSAVRKALLGGRVLVWLFVVVYSALPNHGYNSGFGSGDSLRLSKFGGAIFLEVSVNKNVTKVDWFGECQLYLQA